MVNELATGYVSIVAETSKLAAQVTKEFGGIERAAVGYGRGIGKSLAEGVKQTPPVDVKELEQVFQTAEKSRAATVKRTTTEIEGLRRKEAIAQAQLTEAEEKYSANSSQMLRAKDRHATASQKVQLAEAKAASEIERSDKAITEAKKAVDDAKRSLTGYADAAPEAASETRGAFRKIADAAGDAFKKLPSPFGKLAREGAKSGGDTGRSFSKAAAETMKAGGTAAGNAFKSTLGAILTSQAITGLLGGIKNAFGALIPEVVAASDATDKFKSTLNFAGLEASTIEGLTKATKDYADRTVYDLGDIQSVTAQLAANGVKGFDSLAEAAGNLNAVAGGSADTFKSVGTVLTQTAGQGKLTTENWNQLSDAIPGASGMLQDAMRKNGAFTGNFREAMEKGQITAEEFNQAISDLGMTDAAKEAATATTTFEGAIGNLQATAVTGLMGPINALKPAITVALGGVATALGPIFDKVTEVVEGIAPRLEDMAGGFATWAESFNLDGITGAIGGAIDMARDFFGGFKDGVGDLGGLVGPIVTVLTGPLGILKDAIFGLFKGSDMADIGRRLGEAIRPVADVYASLADVLGGAFEQLAPVVGDLLKRFAPLIKELADKLVPVFGELIEELLPPVIDLIADLAPIVMDVVDAVVPLIGELARALVPVLGAVVRAVAPLVTKLVEALAPILIELVETIVPPLTEILGAVADAIENVVAPVLGVLIDLLIVDLKNAFEAIMPIVETAWNYVADTVRNGVDMISGLIEAISAILRGDWEGAWAAMQGVTDAFWRQLRNVVDSGIRLVKDIILGVMTRFIPNWSGSWDTIKTAGAKAWDWIRDTATGAFDRMRTGIETTVTKLKGALGQIWDGIKGVFARPINAVVRFINDGIVGGYNTVAKAFKMPTLGKLAVIPGYAGGGILPGSSSWRAGDDQLIAARAGEGITMSEALRDPYERKRLLGLNAAVKRGISPEDFRSHFDGYATGGLVQYQGKTFTRLFASLLARANELGGGGMRISQGGYRPATSYSGTSHQGDAVDITGSYRRFIAPLRSLGIPTWDREGKGDWAPHAHGVPLPGSGTAAGSAVWQAQDYLRGGDGLGGRDNGPRGGVIGSLVDGIKGALAAGFSSVTDWFSGILDKLSAPFEALRSTGGGLLGELVTGIGTKLKDDLTGWVKDKLGVGYAAGTRSARRGVAWVGERGAELIRFDGGEQVIPAAQLGAATGAGSVHIEHLDLRLPEWVQDFDDTVRFLQSWMLQVRHA